MRGSLRDEGPLASGLAVPVTRQRHAWARRWEALCLLWRAAGTLHRPQHSQARHPTHLLCTPLRTLRQVIADLTPANARVLWSSKTLEVGCIAEPFAST